MHNFKAGDKVKIKSSQISAYWYANKIGEEVTLGRHGTGAGASWSVIEYCGKWVSEEDIEPINTFDLKKNPWFIRTGTKEKSEAAQKWLFDQGMEWRWSMKLLLREDYNEICLTNLSSYNNISPYILHAEDIPFSAQEIFLEFETVVKSVKYPEISKALTEQQKNILELEETIKKAQEQITQLKTNS